MTSHPMNSLILKTKEGSPVILSFRTLTNYESSSCFVFLETWLTLSSNTFVIVMPQNPQSEDHICVKKSERGILCVGDIPQGSSRSVLMRKWGWLHMTLVPSVACCVPEGWPLTGSLFLLIPHLEGTTETSNLEQNNLTLLSVASALDILPPTYEQAEKKSVKMPWLGTTLS